MTDTPAPPPEVLTCPHCHASITARKTSGMDPLTRVICQQCSRKYTLSEGREPPAIEAAVVAGHSDRLSSRGESISDDSDRPVFAPAPRPAPGRRSEEFVIGAFQVLAALCYVGTVISILAIGAIFDAGGDPFSTVAGLFFAGLTLQGIAVIVRLLRDIRDRLPPPPA